MDVEQLTMEFEGISLKQKRDRYEMHKYWGKKPANYLSELIETFSSKGDIVLDPFAGYGVFCCEAYLLHRNVIANDLNPVAHFLNRQLLSDAIDLELMRKQWQKIKVAFEPCIKKWFFSYEGSKEMELISILRNKSGLPLKAKYRTIDEKGLKEIVYTKAEAEEFLKFERESAIKDWYPKDPLIPNSRISARQDMTVADLFTKRTLACHAKLLGLIKKHSTGNELQLFLMAFTANLANCSKLVPPIKTRGDMAQGAWMTGFYIGETYIENNVLHYFENRLEKVIRGKKDFLENLKSNSSNSRIGELRHVAEMTSTTTGYIALNSDVKCLNIPDSSIDYIFTDPPYGEAVPYFEQSIIWNSWLKLKPNYEGEIVVSDSKARTKNSINYENEINIAFSEISRILKPGKFFSLTYHSLSGTEWKAITNACILNGFDLHDFQWLIQKTFTPRQLNKQKSIKGDVLITLKKLPQPIAPKDMESKVLNEKIVKLVSSWLLKRSLDTNEIFLKVMKMLFQERIFLNDFDLLSILTSNFQLQDSKWLIKQNSVSNN